MPRTKKKLTSALRVKRKQPKGAGKVLSAQSCRMIERRNAAFKMRRDGYTRDEIAAILGVDVQTVSSDLRFVLSHMVGETAETVEEHRVLEELKMDAITRSFMPLTRERILEFDDPKVKGKKIQKVIGPDHAAASIVMTASVHKRKLLALDVPEVKRLEVSAIREYKGVDMDKI